MSYSHTPPLQVPHPYLIHPLSILSQQIDRPTLGQQDGRVCGGRRPGPALVLVQDGREAAVLGGSPAQVGAALLGLQRATLGAAAAAVQAGAALDGRARADLLQHAVEGGGPGGQVVQGHGVGHTVHLWGTLLLVGGLVVRGAVGWWPRWWPHWWPRVLQALLLLLLLLVPLPRAPATVEKVLQAVAEHGALGELLDFL